MAPSVSIVLCTRNRAESLRLTLASLGGCDVPEDLAVELVVVDNASTDGTNRIIEDAVFHGQPVRRVMEQTPGLSRARNTGLRETRSDVVLFTDDDVRVPGNWIAGMCRPILEGEADAVAGGVHFPAAYEPQLAREPFRSRRGWLASTEATNPDDPGFLVGANMAFSRRVVETLGDFDPALGAGALGFCEESLFAFRMLDAGFRIRTAFAVSVEHHFDLSRLTPATLTNMAVRMARSAAYVDYHWEHKDPVAARAQARRAAAFLMLERLKTPWRMVTGGGSLPLTQRVQTFNYWSTLAGFKGLPHRYERKPDHPS